MISWKIVFLKLRLFYLIGIISSQQQEGGGLVFGVHLNHRSSKLGVHRNQSPPQDYKILHYTLCSLKWKNFRINNLKVNLFTDKQTHYLQSILGQNIDSAQYFTLISSEHRKTIPYIFYNLITSDNSHCFSEYASSTLQIQYLFAIFMHHMFFA